MFTIVYFLLSRPWSPADFRAFIHIDPGWPFYAQVFKFRVLMPALGQALSRGLGLEPQWIYRGTTWVSTFLLMVAYRRYLENFLAPGFAILASFSIVFPLIWNYCLLNSIYYPFDIPAILFFVLGCHFMYRRNWLAYYITLGLALLNRDTSAFLVFVFAFTGYGNIPRRKLAVHLIAQAAMWWGIKALMLAVMPGSEVIFTQGFLTHNLGTIRNMLTTPGNALTDWVKVPLAFGGSLLVLPWVWRRQPEFLKRTLLVIIPFVVVVLFKTVIEEVRVYGELVPVVFTPVVYFIARELGGVTPRGISRPNLAVDPCDRRSR